MNYKKEIEEIYKEFCKDEGIKYSEEELKKFQEFLDIDFFDWVRTNLKIWVREHYPSEQ